MLPLSKTARAVVHSCLGVFLTNSQPMLSLNVQTAVRSEIVWVVLNATVDFLMYV